MSHAIDSGASVSAAIRTARSKGRPALVAYITAGFPRLDGFRRLLSAVAEAANVVEVGVPFTDPMADGSTIQRSSRLALEQGVNLPWILEEIAAAKPRAPILLMSYLNPLLAYGIERLPQAIIKAGVAGLIVPDLPFEECAEMRAVLDAAGCALVQFVTPVTPPERMQMLCEGTRGFIYAVTMTGTTGKHVGLPQQVLDYFAQVRKLSPHPVCAGFGIRGPDQVQRMAPHVNGVIVGSALIEVIERGEDPAVFLRTLRG